MDARVTPQCCSDADKIRKFVADSAGIEVTEVTNETHLANDLGLDWLDQIELLVMIEDEFVGVDFFAGTSKDAVPRQLDNRWPNFGICKATSAMTTGGSRRTSPSCRSTTWLSSLIDWTRRFRCFVWCWRYSGGRQPITLRRSVEPDLRET